MNDRVKDIAYNVIGATTESKITVGVARLVTDCRVDGTVSPFEGSLAWPISMRYGCAGLKGVRLLK